MKLTIIVPIYNTEIIKLQRCFESIQIIQTKSYECILIDDGSTEKVSTYLNEYANNNPGFRYIRKENGGVSSARNLGIDNAQGEYICFVDSDDAIEPKVYDYFLSKEFDSDIVLSDLDLVDGKSHIRWHICGSEKITYENMIRRVLVDGKVNGPYCKFLKTSFLNKYSIRFHEGIVIAEDLIFFLDVLIHKPVMAYINEVSYYYFREEATGVNRLKANRTELFFNYKKAFEKEIDCISRGNFSTKENENLLQMSEEKYIKSIFNTTLELIENKIDKTVIEHDLKKALEYTKVKKSRLLTKTRKGLLLKRHWVILSFLALLRRKYLKVKSLI